MQIEIKHLICSGAQFGTIVSMPLSGLLADQGFDGGWPSIFYVFGIIGVLWSIAFLVWVKEDPSSHPTMDVKEKTYILKALWGTANVTVCSKFAFFIQQIFINFTSNRNSHLQYHLRQF